MTEKRSALRKLARPLAAVLLAATTLTALQGCAGLALGTAVVGTLAATDRRTIGVQTEDKTIFFKGQGTATSIAGDSGHVSVTSFNRKVLLTGEVPSEAAKAAVAREIAAINGVDGVINELVVAGASSLPSRSNDALITGKVKAAFVDARDLSANAVKVTTERGVVYLMGLVTEREGQRAAEIASRVGGVQKVVKIFDYISEDELQRLTRSTEQAGK